MIVVKDYVRFVSLPIEIVKNLNRLEKVDSAKIKYKMMYPVFISCANKWEYEGHIIDYDKKNCDDVIVNYIYFDNSIFELVEDNNIVSLLKECIEDKEKEICRLKKVSEVQNKNIKYWAGKYSTINDKYNKMKENSNTFNNPDMYWNERYIKLRKDFYSLKEENEELKNKLNDTKFTLGELKSINVSVDERCRRLIDELKECKSTLASSKCQNTWYDEYRKYVDPEKDIPVNAETLINLSENFIENFHIVSYPDKKSEKCEKRMTITISDSAPQEIINGVLLAIGRNSDIFNRSEIKEMEIKCIEIE